MLKIKQKVRVIKDNKEIGQGIVSHIYYDRGNNQSHIGYIDKEYLKEGLNIPEILPIQSNSLYIKGY